MIAFEDDASRKILSIADFAHATVDNAIAVLQRAGDAAEAYHSLIIEINTDQGSQFYASGGKKKSKGTSRFERYLNVRYINHIPLKRNNPQTNGKVRSSGGFNSTEGIDGGLIHIRVRKVIQQSYSRSSRPGML